MTTSQGLQVVIPATILVTATWLAVPFLWMAVGGTTLVVTFATGIAFDMGRGRW